VKLSTDEVVTSEQMRARTASKADVEPVTGAELGAGAVPVEASELPLQTAPAA